MQVSYINLIANLRIHWDGSSAKGRSQLGCPGRQRAIESGLAVPPSVAKSQSSKSTPVGNQMTLFSQGLFKQNFDNLTFNQIMMIWLVRLAIPWNRLEDTWLRAAVQFLRPGSKLYGQTWASKEAARLNLSMKHVVFDELEVSFRLHHFFFYPLIS